MFTFLAPTWIVQILRKLVLYCCSCAVRGGVEAAAGGHLLEVGPRDGGHGGADQAGVRGYQSINQ